MLERGVWPSGWRTSLPALAVTAEALTPLDDTRLLAEGVRGMEEAETYSCALRDTMDIFARVDVWPGIMRYK